MEATTIHAVTAIRERNEAERQLSALINAVRDHEKAGEANAHPRRRDDFSLYRRVREILGEDS
jgi:hypothetical protein